MSEYIVNETVYPGATKQEIVGELVRCRDCRFYNEYFVTCNRDEHGRGMLSIVNPYTDYCSYGVRKDA